MYYSFQELITHNLTHTRVSLGSERKVLFLSHARALLVYVSAVRGLVMNTLWWGKYPASVKKEGGVHPINRMHVIFKLRSSVNYWASVYFCR